MREMIIRASKTYWGVFILLAIPCLFAYLVFANSPEEEVTANYPKDRIYVDPDAGGLEIENCTFEFTEPNEPEGKQCVIDTSINYANETFTTEPNEPEITDDQQKIAEWQELFHYKSIEICNHENRIVCSVYGCGCWTCMDCDKHSEGTKIYFKED